jgi:hypothetical protein
MNNAAPPYFLHQSSFGIKKPSDFGQMASGKLSKILSLIFCHPNLKTAS